jgi:hypothetical protein
MKIATEFRIGDVAYIPAIKPSEYHSFDEVIVTDINIQVSNLKILYSVETTEGKTSAVSADKIFKSPSMIPATEKEYELLKLCGELVGMIKDIPADFTPRTKEVREVVAYFKAKNPEAPTEVKTETEPEREHQPDEDKKKRKREYMKEYLQRPDIVERKREYMREYMKKYLRRPGIAEKNKQRAKAWRDRKKAEAKAV